MHVYPTRDRFDARLGGVRKWMRAGRAIDLAPTLARGVAHSIGDSLTYWWDSTAALASPDLVGHRRYLTVLAPIDGDMTVMVAPKRDLTRTEAYSDLTDRERFVGPAEPVAVPRGGVFIADIDEAVRVSPDPDVAATVLHVTVEGHGFPGK